MPRTFPVIFLTIIIFLCSFVFYVSTLGHPPFLIWDEQLHVPEALRFLKGSPLQILQDPPLGKILMGWSIDVGGKNLWAIRLPSLLSAAGVAATLFWGGARMTKSWGGGILAAGLWMTSTLAYPMAKMGTLDMMMVFGMVLSFAVFCEIPLRASSRTKSVLLYAAVFLAGAGGAIKFLGFLLLPISLLGLIQMRERWPLRRSLLHWAVGVAVLPLGLLTVSYAALGLPPRELFSQIAGMYRFHMEDTMFHNQLSKWYQWFVFQGNHWFYRSPKLTDPIIAIPAMNNPVLWVFGGLSTGFLFFWGWLKRDRVGFWISLAVIVQMLFWVFFKQRTLLYYALPMEPFFCLGIVWTAKVLLMRRPGLRPFILVLNVVILTASALFFTKYFPWVSGRPERLEIYEEKFLQEGG